MSPSITVDGTRDVHVVDAECGQRPCFWLFFDKGSFTPGVGYTRYYDKARACCGTNHLHGCPHVGAHLKCGECNTTGDAVPYDENGDLPDLPDECPTCHVVGRLYWLADVLPPPSPCCDSPRVAKARNPHVYRQRCQNCGSWLTGQRLERVRSAA